MVAFGSKSHLKELKRQTSLIAETSEVPSESDELKVDGNEDENGHFVIKASLCCEDRSDLLHDLIKTLKALRFRTLKAEITTLAGRVKNVLFITEDHDNGEQHYACINSIHEVLKEVMKKSTTGGSHELAYGNVKRQRRTRN
ncbi:transcription factor bHLH30 [Trifolium repens]|nr:transcription factor bHLH30 [Trifolium repens]